MKVEDIKFTEKKADYIKRCVFNKCEKWYVEGCSDKYKKQLYKIIHKSENIDGFIDKYLNRTIWNLFRRGFCGF